MTLPNTKTFRSSVLYDEAGFSVIPVHADGSKVPTIKWETYKHRRPTEAERADFFGNGNFLGIVCGAVSQNLLIEDFDKVGLYSEYESLCDEHGFGDLVRSLPLIETPSGGNHLYMRSKSTVPGNVKLARYLFPLPVDVEITQKKNLEYTFVRGKEYRVVEQKGQRYALMTSIETRGEGGQAVAPPSPGYRMLRGRPDQVPLLTEEQVTALLDIARLMNEWNDPALTVDEPKRRGRPTTELKPGQDYSNRGPILDLLQSHGWTVKYRHGETFGLQRPGKVGRGISATYNHGGHRLFYVFSSNASPFDNDRAYTGFAVYTLLEQGGSFEAAASQLGRERYGASASAPPSGRKDQWNGDTSGSSKKSETDSEAEEIETTDLALAERWAHEVEGEYIYVEGDQWWRYEDGRWIYSSHEKVEQVVVFFLCRLLNEGLLGRVKVTAALVSNVKKLAKSFLGPHNLAEFNAHDEWIPLRNGVYDLSTDTLLPHDPNHKMTHQSPYEFRADAECPVWIKCLQDWLILKGGCPCTEWIEIVQEWFGYCLISDNRAQLSMFWVGEGGNGKGVATRVLEKLVGPDSCTAIAVEQLHDPYHRADIYGKLVGFVNEPDRRAMQKNGNWFKALTGGDDQITARRPTEKVFTFKSVCRMTVSCNELPATNDPTRAFFRRIVPIEWRANISDEKKDVDLDDKLRLELPGIFNWAVAGLRRYRERRKFLVPEESLKLLKAYQLSEDNVGRFLEEDCLFGTADDFWIEAAELYMHYKSWCENNGVRSETANALGRRLSKRGCERKLRRNADKIVVRAWVGLRRRNWIDEGLETENEEEEFNK